jgi:hypothetical protein
MGLPKSFTTQRTENTLKDLCALAQSVFSVVKMIYPGLLATLPRFPPKSLAKDQ